MINVYRTCELPLQQSRTGTLRASDSSGLHDQIDVGCREAKGIAAVRHRLGRRAGVALFLGLPERFQRLSSQTSGGVHESRPCTSLHARRPYVVQGMAWPHTRPVIDDGQASSHLRQRSIRQKYAHGYDRTGNTQAVLWSGRSNKQHDIKTLLPNIVDISVEDLRHTPGARRRLW